MTIVEIGARSPRALDIRQRWGTYLSALVAVLLFGTGLFLRNSIVNAVIDYENIRAGISVQYPRNWLLDTDSTGNYVFRIRDMARSGFKTTIQISIVPIGVDTNPRNIADSLARRRAQTFIAYTTRPIEPFLLNGELESNAVSYTYVDQTESPFLTGAPSVVRGLDILTIRRDQAIVITFRAEISLFDAEYPKFENFLQNLEF